MNLITCVKNCVHQKDGYCNLDSQAHLGQKLDGCCYYRPVSPSGQHKSKAASYDPEKSPVQE